ncbi:UDP-N-acetylmuramoyl-L-alanine--D-glutamate ligase [Corynebacterium breve]|uniref:UDP-N-acetylmuramoylalanine--D-glutamate ligase n=1 Tax=Corynebacterium breve TaxID=3049799 RepID=A0ABY8VBD4_9CORY|nr:UDP-N-acetylmuramoyl-L-alanine--D-glutamate ligase [Corynebacterium breve]WIM66975.1 UDP-N-acetylmuramoyl-L-alanine--D-glutamate ligase [Corynebacterium breve]
MTLPGFLTGHVLVAGAGVSGLGAARLLADLGVTFTVADDNEVSRNNVRDITGAPTVTVSEARESLQNYSLVVTSPGWRPDSPLLVEAISAGIEVIGDVELCFRLDRAGVFGAPRTWLVVTGTNGKTTTTGMLASMMTQAGERTGLTAVACGNIGLAVSDALTSDERVDILVAELSSFQLHWSSELIPDAGVLLNLADDHIDWHGSFEAYADAKAKVLQAPIAVAGVDDEFVLQWVHATGRDDIIGFTLNQPETGQIGVVDGFITESHADIWTRIASAEGIEPPGQAGVFDALAAAAVARSQGATPEDIEQALRNFQVDGHRGAVVHRAGGVQWVDNSKATNPHAAHSALEGAGTIAWIAGGQLKGAAIDPLIEAHKDQFRAVGLLGIDREILADAFARIAPNVPVLVSESTDPDEAMAEVVKFVAHEVKSGDSVLLAPAAASLDMYTGMAHRGDVFAQAARANAIIPEPEEG